MSNENEIRKIVPWGPSHARTAFDGGYDGGRASASYDHKMSSNPPAGFRGLGHKEIATPIVPTARAKQMHGLHRRYGCHIQFRGR